MALVARFLVGRLSGSAVRKANSFGGVSDLELQCWAGQTDCVIRWSSVQQSIGYELDWERLLRLSARRGNRPGQ